MNQLDRDFKRIKEQVETLTGERGPQNKPGAAVLRGDLAAFAKRPIVSSQVTATPTLDQFNALQADMAALYAAVLALAKQ